MPPPNPPGKAPARAPAAPREPPPPVKTGRAPARAPSSNLPPAAARKPPPATPPLDPEEVKAAIVDKAFSEDAEEFTKNADGEISVKKKEALKAVYSDKFKKPRPVKGDPPDEPVRLERNRRPADKLDQPRGYGRRKGARSVVMPGKPDKAESPHRKRQPLVKGLKQLNKLKYMHAKRLKTIRHKLFDEGLWVGFAGTACVVLMFALAWCRRRCRRRRAKKSELPTHAAPPSAKGKRASRSPFGGVEALPAAVAAACRENRSGPVEAWLRTCGSPDARCADAPRRGAAHIAAAHGAAAACRAVLLAGADPNAADDCGDRPLHLAAVAGSGACVKVLLDHGADPRALDAVGADAKSRATAAGNTGCALLISRRLAADRRGESRGGVRARAHSNDHQA